MSAAERSYVSIRYSIIAPDSHRVMLVLGSVMAGTRPLGLSFSKGSFLRSAISVGGVSVVLMVCVIFSSWEVLGSLVHPIYGIYLVHRVLLKFWPQFEFLNYNEGLAAFRTLVAAHKLRNSHVLRLWDEKCSPNIGFSEWGLGKHEGNWNEPMNLVV